MCNAHGRIRISKTIKRNDGYTPPAKNILVYLSVLLLFAAALAAPLSSPAFAESLTSVDGAQYGISGQVYEISTPEQLAEFAALVNGGTTDANAVLLANIDLASISNWTPIGKYESDGTLVTYSGVFDGCGFEVKNLKVDVTYGDAYANVGLFGNVSGTVKNLTVSGSVKITSDSEATAGGIAGGLATGGVIDNCVSHVNVTANAGTLSQAGGIAGTLAGSITNCKSDGDINIVMTSGENDAGGAGGIAGINDNGSIKNCESTATVMAKGEDDASDVRGGGIAGINTSGSIIENCLSSADVTATGGASSYAGGIVGGEGLLHGSGTIKNCVVTGGTISGDTGEGAVLGNNGATVENCAWNNVKGPSFGIGSTSSNEGAAPYDSIADSVMMLSASIDKNEFAAAGETATIKLKLAPTTATFSEHSGAVEMNIEETYNKSVVSVTADTAAGTYTITALAAGSTNVTVKPILHATNFAGEGYVEEGTEYTFTFPVTVAAADSGDGGTSGSGSSGSTGGGGGGGCSAGFGALALLAAIPLSLRRKK